MKLTEFLNARLDEDEAVAQRAHASTPGRGLFNGPGLDPVIPRDRLLAEVEAKRRIMRLAYEATGLDMDKDLDRAVEAREKSGIAFVGERMLMALAAPYADHPDYDEEWRP
jgi:hypothetical protein